MREQRSLGPVPALFPNSGFSPCSLPTPPVPCSCAWLRSRLRRVWKFTDPVRHVAEFETQAPTGLV